MRGRAGLTLGFRFIDRLNESWPAEAAQSLYLTTRTYCLKMSTWEAFDVKARKKVKIIDPEIKQLKNGRWAVVGKSAETGIKVFRFLTKAEAEKYGKK